MIIELMILEFICSLLFYYLASGIWHLASGIWHLASSPAIPAPKPH